MVMFLPGRLRRGAEWPMVAGRAKGLYGGPAGMIGMRRSECAVPGPRGRTGCISQMEHSIMPGADSMHHHLRIARPVRDLAAARAMYCRGLGLQVLGHF